MLTAWVLTNARVISGRRNALRPPLERNTCFYDNIKFVHILWNEWRESIEYKNKQLYFEIVCLMLLCVLLHFDC